MRKLLCGLAVAVVAVLVPASLVAAEEAEGEHPEGADIHAIVEEIHHAEEAGEVDFAVAECAILALENNDTERCIESPSPIMPATNELIYGGLAFLVLLLLLRKFGLPAINKMSAERTERIRNDLDTAERARVEAESVKAQYEAQLVDARAEASRIIEEARADAEQVRRDLVARAEAEATELRQRNAEQVAGERDRVMGELQGQVATLAIELAEKVVESNLDREANTRLIESYIASVGAR